MFHVAIVANESIHCSNNNNAPELAASQDQVVLAEARFRAFAAKLPPLTLVGMSQDSNDPTRRAPRSADSVLSAGIGESTVAVAAKLPPELDLPHLSPEGGADVDDVVFDCIVYLIFCAEHQRLAVTNVNKCKCTWLPFVALPDGVTWQEASHDGVTALIGRNDAEVDAEEAEKMTPIYTMRYVHLLRAQLPNNRSVLRLAQHVLLERNTPFLCCQNTDRVNWLPMDQINNEVDRIWGPELWILMRMLASPTSNIINEFTCDNALFFLDQDSSWEHKMLRGANLTKTQVLEIYVDYVEHTWPAFYMCYEAFRAYFIKYGHPVNEVKLKRLFTVYCVNRRPFVDFHEFLTGLVAMEPSCPSTLESRLYFIFRYYSTDQQYLSAGDLAALLTDANPTWAPEIASAEAQSMLTARSTTCLALEEFIEQYRVEGEQKLLLLCRSPKSILAAISMSLSAKTDELRQSQMSLLETNRDSRGGCWACRPQHYEYGTHYVTFNSGGRCVEPMVIQQQQSGSQTANEVNTVRKYSLEYAFALASVPNIFMDLLRGFFDKTSSRRNSLGLMATEPDWPHFVKYLRVMCKDISQLLVHEDKLIKINASAIVIGDLRGNLRDLLALEQMFFPGFPIIPESLVFLGNYSGDYGFGVECLVYLFALKLCSPNKVFLLRGSHEMDGTTAILLKKECHSKYGAAYGKIVHSILLAIFAQLPIALVVDDTILCTHSGIPSTVPLDGMLRLPKEMADIERDAPMAHEIITRYPEEETVAAQVSSTLGQDSNSGSQVKSKNAKQTKAKQGARKTVTGSDSDGSISQAESDSDVSFSGANSSQNFFANSKDELKNFKFTAPTTKKLKPTFLTSLKTTTRKSIMFKDISTLKSRLTAESLSEKVKPPEETFGRQELTDYLDANGCTCLIRSNTVCPDGFSVTFAKRCVTVFSCSNHEKQNNQAAVVLIDGSDASIRCIRYDTSCVAR